MKKIMKRHVEHMMDDVLVKISLAVIFIVCPIILAIQYSM